MARAEREFQVTPALPCYAACEAYQHARFLPFVGPSYGPTSWWNQAVLVLGESHDNESLADSPDLTREVIHKHMESHRGDHSTLTNVIEAFGMEPDAAMRASFWQQAAYYVYMQCPVTNTRVRPTIADWKRSVAAFEEVVRALDPALILVLGSETWNGLPCAFGGGPDVVLPTGESSPSSVYAYGASLAMAFAIHDPASADWRASEWKPWISAALRTSHELQNVLGVDYTRFGGDRRAASALR